VKGAHADEGVTMEEKDRAQERREEALDKARRDAAGRKTEDQGTDGGLTEATHGVETDAPTRHEGEVPPSD
jgi:hypothetical protein